MRVYVVDDDECITNSVRFLLTTLKMECRTFSSGDEFLEAVSSLPPGCIILDVSLGKMNGIEVQEELRRLGINWPIVFFTGDCSVPLIVKAIQNGAVEFVVKPSTEKDILTALHKASVSLAAAA